MILLLTTTWINKGMYEYNLLFSIVLLIVVIVFIKYCEFAKNVIGTKDSWIDLTKLDCFGSVLKISN